MFLSHSAEIFRRGTLLCCVSESSSSEKFMERGGALGLSVEKLSSHSAESFSGGGMFSVSQVSGIGKIHASEG